MAKEVFGKKERVTPKAVRIVEFTRNDMKENIIPPTNQQELEEFARNALVLTDGNDILQYAEEYPIVKYKCEENTCRSMQSDYRLNSFIKSITVSTASHGKRFSVGSGIMESEFVNNDTVAYYEDNAGVCHHILQYNILRFLFKKPNLVLSPEGVLVFYTKDEILATVDCMQYCWVSGHHLDLTDSKIISITVQDYYCNILIVKNNISQQVKLRFNFDLTANIMIQPKISKI